MKTYKQLEYQLYTQFREHLRNKLYGQLLYAVAKTPENLRNFPQPGIYISDGLDAVLARKIKFKLKYPLSDTLLDFNEDL